MLVASTAQTTVTSMLTAKPVRPFPSLRFGCKSVGFSRVPRWMLFLLPLGACAPSRPAPVSSVEVSPPAVNIAEASSTVSDESASEVRRRQLERAVRWEAVRRDFPDLLADVTFGTAYPELLEEIFPGTTVTAYFRGPRHDCWRAELERSLPTGDADADGADDAGDADDAEPPLRLRLHAPVQVDTTGRSCRTVYLGQVGDFLALGGESEVECWGGPYDHLGSPGGASASETSWGVLTRVDEVGAFFYGREVRVEIRCNTRREVAPCKSGPGFRMCELCDLQPQLAPGCRFTRCGHRVTKLGRSPLPGSACPKECPYHEPPSTPKLDRLEDVARQAILSVPRNPSDRYALYWTEKACREAGD